MSVMLERAGDVLCGVISWGSYLGYAGDFHMQGSSEWLLFRLAHPVCLVKKISIRPFLAWFQRVSRVPVAMWRGEKP